MSEIIDELESLLFDWDAGTLGDPGVERVREILRTSEEARAFYAQQQVITAALNLDVDAGLVPTGDVSASQVPPTSNADKRVFSSRRNPTISFWTAAAAAMLICGLTGRILYLELGPSKPVAATTQSGGEQRGDAKEATSSGVALLTRLVDVQWRDQQTPLEVGDAIAPGRVAFDAGFLQIEFFCGATVVVEGPADLDLKSSTLARVHQGKLRAHVPPAAKGFSIEVDDMKVVDLGTEFGLAVSAQAADVHVFDGEVELHPSQASSQLLTAGQAITRTEAGLFQDKEVAPQGFLDIEALAERADGQQRARYRRWKAWSERLASDPRLIAYYDFDQSGGWKRKLHSSVEPGNSELDGAIVGARRVGGRWAKKAGLEFKRPGDRVRVQIPGEFGSLTFACWTKIDSLDRWYNSLFLTDGYNQGEPHWQILDTGQLFFSVRHRPDDGQRFDAAVPPHQKVLSPPFWTHHMSGRWIHLATTYDVEAGRTTHYLNGDVLHQESIDPEVLVQTTRIGAASIGNWSIPTRPDEEFAIRNLNGSIDEFAIFAAVLSADEVREMYVNGKP